jgi:IclR family acetate operon transcriptional repressor
MADAEGPQYPIASVDNALRLLLLLAEADGVRLSDAARSLGVANSTAHRLLAMLQHRGFVEQDAGTKRYCAGPALVEVGLRAAGRIQIRDLARPEMARLAAELRETVHLGVLEGTEVRYLEAVESSRALRVAVRTGLTRPAHCTSTGKALLAELAPDELRARYPASRLPALTPRSVTSRGALEKELASVRELGYASNEGENEVDLTSIAVVVRGRAGAPVGAISVAAPSERLGRDRFDEVADVIRAAAARITERFG